MALLFIFIKGIRKMTTSLGSTVRSLPWHHCLFHVWLQGASNRGWTTVRNMGLRWKKRDSLNRSWQYCIDPTDSNNQYNNMLLYNKTETCW